MGFGLLFIGYLFAFGFTSGVNFIVSIVGIFGSIVLFAASSKLMLYSSSFRITRVMSVSLGVSYLLNTIVQLLTAYNVVSDAYVLSRVCRAFIILSVFVFNMFMYFGIAEVSRSVDDKKLTVSAYRDLIVMIIYYLCTGLSFSVTGASQNIKSIIALLSALLGLVWLVLSVWLVISSYMRICLPGDEDMPIKNNK
ncbi:MAG: hypothetical protein IJ391_07140 [Clostridia bacterium]|nr:hypothetical protein [Clostridia bacterium]